MKVTRTHEVETDTFKIGDQISFHLKDFGDFTATAQLVTNKGAYFLFDSIVDIRCMNEERTNEGGFAASDLKKWLDTVLLDSFPKDIRSRIKEITIPSLGQMFTPTPETSCVWDEYDSYDDIEFPFTDNKTAIKKYQHKPFGNYWLRNAHLPDEYLNDGFLWYDSLTQLLDYSDADEEQGVVPLIIIK